LNTDTRDAVYGLQDLDRWNSSSVSLAVVGKPVAHSLSPAMHNAALARMATQRPELRAWRYHKFELAPEQLAEALPKFHRAGFVGLNFTVPHKEIVLGLAQEVSSFARAAGAANTLERTSGGWRAHNTDGYGLATALRAEFGIDFADKPVVLLGAGGAARAAAAQCLADAAREIWIGNRTMARADALAQQLEGSRASTRIRAFDPREVGQLPRGAIVINATSLGLKPSDPAPAEIKKFPAPAVVYDMIYNPPVTALLRDARDAGIRCANGLSMLVHQGARALSIWTGQEAPAEVMQGALRTNLAR
jgi:shikimate dehydrogenase